MLCCMHHCRDQLTHAITRATAIEALRALNVFHVCETDCDEVRWNFKSKSSRSLTELFEYIFEIIDT